jgi:hypothetical protein
MGNGCESRGTINLLVSFGSSWLAHEYMVSPCGNSTGEALQEGFVLRLLTNGIRARLIRITSLVSLGAWIQSASLLFCPRFLPPLFSRL